MSRKRATINTIKNQGRWQKPQGPKSTLILEKVCSGLSSD